MKIRVHSRLFLLIIICLFTPTLSCAAFASFPFGKIAVSNVQKSTVSENSTPARATSAAPTMTGGNVPPASTPVPASTNEPPSQSATPESPSLPSQEEQPRAATTLPPGITFSCGWEDDYIILPQGQWEGMQVVDPTEERFYRDPKYARDGQFSVRVEVQPGDIPTNAGTSGERAEVYGMLDENKQPMYENVNSGNQFYAFSVRLDPDWQPPIVNDRRWGIILQLHGPNELNTSPAFSFNVVDKFYVYLHSGNIEKKEAPYFVGDAFDLSDSHLNPGHWVDFMIEIIYSPYPTGAVVVWRRDEGEATFREVLNLRNVPTLQYLPSEGVKDHYWKHGYYRPIGSDITSVLWLDSITRGISFERVAREAFNTKGNLYLNRAFLPFTKLN